jgi:hypothetical protein
VPIPYATLGQNCLPIKFVKLSEYCLGKPTFCLFYYLF